MTAAEPNFGHYVARGIRGRRAWMGMEQTELGRRVSLSSQTISQIELGRRKLTVDELPVFCRALETTLADLVREADPDDLAAVGLTPPP